ncbi:hypothetical protein EGR_09435 [Echinococcus granulosus]|uniref:Uncharacterized protein n=1 Tax=Echinococcus granulosus TaxID=6210 RepID=W6UB90_ECHGR|nr:hypothetical protein EGR_09435 [Echinococcus granulosus]EUB55722.1 hypothetical protein EGR_09435 [Echinococcus granulosus]
MKIQSKVLTLPMKINQMNACINTNSFANSVRNTNPHSICVGLFSHYLNAKKTSDGMCGLIYFVLKCIHTGVLLRGSIFVERMLMFFVYELILHLYIGMYITFVMRGRIFRVNAIKFTLSLAFCIIEIDNRVAFVWMYFVFSKWTNSRYCIELTYGRKQTIHSQQSYMVTRSGTKLLPNDYVKSRSIFSRKEHQLFSNDCEFLRNNMYKDNHFKLDDTMPCTTDKRKFTPLPLMKLTDLRMTFTPNIMCTELLQNPSTHEANSPLYQKLSSSLLLFV